MLWALLIVLGVSLALLTAPIHVRVDVERGDALRTQVELEGCFGLARWRKLGPARGEAVADGVTGDAASVDSGGAGGAPSGRSARRRRRRRRRNVRRCGQAILDPRVRARVGLLVARLRRAVVPHELWLRARIGLDDPADTGRLWGVLGALSVLSPNALVLEPHFEGPCLRGAARAHLRVVPLRLLAPLVVFLLSPVVLRALLWEAPTAG